MTQAELVNDMNVEISQISRIERGEINTTISTAYAMANALEIPITELFDFNQ